MPHSGAAHSLPAGEAGDEPVFVSRVALATPVGEAGEAGDESEHYGLPPIQTMGEFGDEPDADGPAHAPPTHQSSFDVARHMLEELKAELEPLKQLFKEVLGDKVEKVAISGQLTDSPCVIASSVYVWAPNTECTERARAQE